MRHNRKHAYAIEIVEYLQHLTMLNEYEIAYLDYLQDKDRKRDHWIKRPER